MTDNNELTEKQIDAAQFCLSEFFPKTDGVTLRIAAKETVEAALDIATPANSRAAVIRECIALCENDPNTSSGKYYAAQLRALLDNPQPDSRAEAIPLAEIDALVASKEPFDYRKAGQWLERNWLAIRALLQQETMLEEARAELRHRTENWRPK